MPVPSSTSAVWPLNVAITDAIGVARANGVVNLGTALDVGGVIALDDPPVYSGQAPQGVAIVSAYVVLSDSAELASAGSFRRRGRENVETIDVWTADQSKRTAAAIAGALIALLDGQPLACPDYGTIRGRCELVITLADPGTKAYRAQLRYTARSFNPVPA